VPRVVDDFFQRVNSFGRQFCVFHSDYDMFCIYERTLHNLDLIVTHLSESSRALDTASTSDISSELDGIRVLTTWS